MEPLWGSPCAVGLVRVLLIARSWGSWLPSFAPQPGPGLSRAPGAPVSWGFALAAALGPASRWSPGVFGSALKSMLVLSFGSLVYVQHEVFAALQNSFKCELK